MSMKEINEGSKGQRLLGAVRSFDSFLHILLLVPRYMHAYQLTTYFSFPLRYYEDNDASGSITSAIARNDHPPFPSNIKRWSWCRQRERRCATVRSVIPSARQRA